MDVDNEFIGKTVILGNKVRWIYLGRSKRHRLRSENGPWMSQKWGIYGSIQCKYGPSSVRIVPYYLAQKYMPFCIRIVNGPYLAVFSNFADIIQLAVLYRKVTVNDGKHAVLYPLTAFLLIQHLFYLYRWNESKNKKQKIILNSFILTVWFIVEIIGKNMQNI
jgi:hypothetical protein